MKITKSYLKQVIKEELNKINMTPEEIRYKLSNIIEKVQTDPRRLNASNRTLAQLNEIVRLLKQANELAGIHGLSGPNNKEMFINDVKGVLEILHKSRIYTDIVKDLSNILDNVKLGLDIEKS